MTNFDFAAIRRTVVSAVAAIALSATCVVAAVGPARAAETGASVSQRA